MTSVSYREAGVDMEAGVRAVELMKDVVRATYGPEVLLGIGAFGGLFDVSALKGMDRPVLVASTDGVGTKTKIAAALGRFDTIGFDIVNHCINDILVQGARPLFFLDYIASSRIDPEKVAASCEAAQRPAWPPAVRCWAARRPRCRGSTRPASSTWSARSWAWWIAHRSSTAAASCQGIK